MSTCEELFVGVKSPVDAHGKKMSDIPRRITSRSGYNILREPNFRALHYRLLEFAALYVFWSEL